MPVIYKGKIYQNVFVYKNNSTVDTATAMASDITEGKTAYINGVLVEGTNKLSQYSKDIGVEENTLTINSLEGIDTIVVNSNYNLMVDGGARVNVVIKGGSIEAEGLDPDNVMEGQTILGVTGTHECDEDNPNDLEDAISVENEIMSIDASIFDDAEVEGEMLSIL
jgi:hypothetical protein